MNVAAAAAIVAVVVVIMVMVMVMNLISTALPTSTPLWNILPSSFSVVHPLDLTAHTARATAGSTFRGRGMMKRTGVAV